MSFLTSYVLAICTLLPGSLATYNYINASHFDLRGNQSDICYSSERTLKAQAECLQSLIEFYYGNYFTRTCPDFPQVLAGEQCIGCPWGRLNITAIPKLNETDFLVFPDIKSSCAIAQHVDPYYSYENTVERVMVPALIGGLLVAFCIGMLQIDEIPVRVFSFSFPEPVFLVLIWILAEVGFLLLLSSQDHIEVCDSVTAVLALQVADGLSYAIIIFLTLRRCLRMEVTIFPGYLSSWSSFLWEDTAELNPPYRRLQNVFRFCYFFVPIVLVVLFVLDYMEGPKFGDRKNEESVCLYGSIRDVSFGAIQYSKLVLETLCVFIYAFGPSEKKRRYYVRYCFLWLIFIVCVIVFFLQTNRTLYNPFSLSTTIPRVLDKLVAGQFMELAYAAVLCFMGIFEPFRIGWPTNTSFTLNIAQPVPAQPAP